MPPSCRGEEGSGGRDHLGLEEGSGGRRSSVRVTSKRTVTVNGRCSVIGCFFPCDRCFSKVDVLNYTLGICPLKERISNLS